MLKSISEESHKLIKVNRRSTRTDNQLENCFVSDIFTDESSEYSGESDEDKINTTPLITVLELEISLNENW